MGKASRKKPRRPSSGLNQAFQESRLRVSQQVSEILEQDRSPIALVRLGLLAKRACHQDHQSPDLEGLAKLACGPGCDYCCYPPVSASVPEVADLIAYILSQLPPEEQQRLRLRIRQVLEEVKPMLGKARSKSSVACPFLLQGSCSVYPARPLACRGFNSADKAACQQGYERPAARPPVPSYMPLILSAQSLKEGLLLGLNAAGLKSPLVDLVKASELLWERLDEVLQNWLDGQDAFRDCGPYPDG